MTRIIRYPAQFPETLPTRHAGSHAPPSVSQPRSLDNGANNQRLHPLWAPGNSARLPGCCTANTLSLRFKNRLGDA